MARRTVAKNGVVVHSSSNTLALYGGLLLILAGVSVLARPTSEHYDDDGVRTGEGEDQLSVNLTDNLFASSSWLGIGLSLGFLLVLASMLALCGAGGCCGQIKWFGGTRQQPPMSFSNPMTEPGATMMMPISQIDVRALELDPIVFEPLPTVHDLTPLSSKPYQHGGSQRRNPVIPIVPFSADDAAVYAHDWFEEPHNNFPRRNIEYVKEIGKGWFGQVIEAEARDIVPFAKSIRVIMKVLREDANGIEQMRFLDEARMYRDGEGNILKLMGHCIEKLPFLLIMEYCPQGDLKSFLISNIVRSDMLNSQGQIIKMALDVSKGLEWLHNAGFIHQDLAARNCQVGSENRVVIGDYGLGTQNFRDDYHWSSPSVAIPLRWTAPETLHCTPNVIQILKVTESSNIWSLGVLIWEICEFGKLPYSDLSDDEVITRVIIEKSHQLGRPALPSLLAKEELFRIMCSCWKEDLESRPRLYSIVRELEELHNASASSSSAAVRNSSFTSPSSLSSPSNHPNADEFDSKWEQLAGRSNDDEKRRKKNVSFLDLERRVCQKSDNGSSSLIEEGSYVTAEPQREPDAEEDELQWTKKIERGDITQKVLEKSQSVQDLMVLTHFEQGDMGGDLDSLPFSGKSFLQDELSVGSSTLKKSNSEAAIDNMSLDNSSHTLTPGSVGGATPVSQDGTVVPHDSPSPFAPPPIPRRAAAPPPNISINPGTPNNSFASVEINLIQPTPNQSLTSPTSPSSIIPPNTNSKRIHFKFDSISSSPPPPTSSPPAAASLIPPESRQRLTSTPLRSGSTPSPRVSDFEEGGGGDMVEGDENVFESSSGYQMEGTFSLSPISQSYIAGLDNGGGDRSENKSRMSSILFGPCDDHELASYQGVKSQLSDLTKSYSESESEVSAVSVLVTPHGLPGKDQPKLPRRILFANGDSEAEKKKPEGNNTSSWTTASGSALESSSSSKSMLSFNKTNGSSGDENVSRVSETEEEESDNKKEVVEEDPDEFWKAQLRSLQMAANSTRELFQTGLNEPSSSAGGGSNDNRRFVEDMEADVEELGSLVLHDLEEPDSLQTIIKETREPLNPDKGGSKGAAAGVSAAKLAFETSKATSTASQVSTDVFQTGFMKGSFEASEMEMDVPSSVDSVWGDIINNSIEIRKRKDPPLNSTEVKAVEDGETSGDFVLSKWDQSLIPNKSAIKSPEQQTEPNKHSAMKKSVSFELNKSRKIYEYPPAPPAPVSDSEEEEQKKAVKRQILFGSTSASVSSNPLASSLDWELTQEELEDAEVNHEDWEEEVIPKPGDPMDVYRISGFTDDNFQVRCSSEPFVFSPLAPPPPAAAAAHLPPDSSTLGELRHTRNSLRLDLSRGEASFLDDDMSKSASNPAKLDSGVGSSTNVTPFNTDCDILTKRSKDNSD